MIFIKLSQILALIICLLSSSIAQADGGRAGTGGAGGDLAYFYLDNARDMILKSLHKLYENTQTEDGLKLTEKILRSACVANGALSDTALSTCVDFLITTAKDIIACTEGPNRIDIWAVPGDNLEFQGLFEVDYPEGRQPVSAFTNLGCERPMNSDHTKIALRDTTDILFHYERIRNAPQKHLFRLMAHEFGHKVRYQGQFIDDISPVGGFRYGFELLNTMAHALYMYGSATSAFSVNQEISTQLFKHFFTCQIRYRDLSPIPFSFFNVVTGPTSDYQSRNSRNSNLGFGYELTDLTKQIFPGEQLFLKVEFQEVQALKQQLGEPPESNILLLRKEGERAKVVDDYIIGKNLLSTSPDPDKPLFSLHYKEMNIECRFDGMHYF